MVLFGLAGVLFIMSKARHGLLGPILAGLLFLIGWRAADRHTRTTGWLARFSFEGTEFQYVYTKAPNRGMALVTIDGSPRGIIDLYDPQIVWLVRSVFGGLKAGPHRAEIQVLGRHDSASSGDFIDIDALVL